MITDGKKWHYLAVKSVSALLQTAQKKNSKNIKKHVMIMIIVM